MKEWTANFDGELGDGFKFNLRSFFSAWNLGKMMKLYTTMFRIFGQPVRNKTFKKIVFGLGGFQWSSQIASQGS